MFPGHPNIEKSAWLLCYWGVCTKVAWNSLQAEYLCCTAVSFTPSFNAEIRTVTRLCLMSRSRIQLCSVTFPKACCPSDVFWQCMAVSVVKSSVSCNLSGIGERLEFKFQYAKELFLWAKFVGGILVWVCKCLSLLPVNSSVFSRSLPKSQSGSICTLLSCLSKNLCYSLDPVSFLKNWLRELLSGFCWSSVCGLEHYAYSSVYINQGGYIHRKMVFHWNLLLKHK